MYKINEEIKVVIKKVPEENQMIKILIKDLLDDSFV
mgnify:CR=1 FL=1